MCGLACERVMYGRRDAATAFSTVVDETLAWLVYRMNHSVFLHHHGSFPTRK